MIDAARRDAFFHKFVINFHPAKEDTRKRLNLWGLTRKLSKEEFAKIRGLWKVASFEVKRQRRRLDRMHASLRYKKLLPLIEQYKRKHQQGRGGRMRKIRMQPACMHCDYGGMSGIPAYLLTCPVCKQWLTQNRQETLHLGRRLHR
jgi:hypothetical protein